MTSYGGLPKEAIQAAMLAPAGMAEKTIRQYVPDFRFKSGDTNLYIIEISVDYSTTVVVEAPTEADAISALEDIDALDLTDFCSTDCRLTSLGVNPVQDVKPDLEWEGESA